MICIKCGNAIPEGAAFCSCCGEKTDQSDAGPETPLYQADVKTLLKSGRLVGDFQSGVPGLCRGA